MSEGFDSGIKEVLQDCIERTPTPTESPMTNLDEEAKWRETLPIFFRPVAERHGKQMFVLAFSAGAISEALQLITRRNAGNREMLQALKALAENCNNITTYAMDHLSMDRVKLSEIQLDIVRAVELARPAANNGGQIILPS